MYLLKMSGPQICLCLFTFRPIALKQLNGLTTIEILSWLGGAVVTHPLWVHEVPCSIPGSGKVFLCLIFLFCCWCGFSFLSKNTLFITNVCNSSYNINLFSILYILQNLWPIIRVLRYRPSIFKCILFTINCIVIYIVTNNYIPWNCPTCTIHVNTEVFFNRIKINKSHFLYTLISNFNCALFFNLTKRFVLSNSFVNQATGFVKLTSRSIPLLCSLIKGCEYCECL